MADEDETLATLATIGRAYEYGRSFLSEHHDDPGPWENLSPALREIIITVFLTGRSDWAIRLPSTDNDDGGPNDESDVDRSPRSR